MRWVYKFHKDSNFMANLKELIKKLRADGGLEGIRATAFELAKSNSDGAVEELIRMSNGKSSWFGRYNYDNYARQLIGVEALGESGNQRALEFLRFIYKPRAFIEVNNRKFPGDDGLADTSRTTIVGRKYPNARGELARRLSIDYVTERQTTHNTSTTNINKVPIERIPVEVKERIEKNYLNSSPHIVIREAIRKLERGLGVEDAA